MQTSFIRTLAFEYVDSNEKVLTEDQIPLKFQKEQDDYQPRVKRAKIQPPPPPVEAPKPVPPPEEPCCPGFGECTLPQCCEDKPYQIQLCSECINLLCDKCISDPQRAAKCQQCSSKMCSKCRKVLGINARRYRLRQHRINFKQFQKMHFGDCQCGECLLKEQHSSVLE